MKKSVTQILENHTFSCLHSGVNSALLSLAHCGHTSAWHSSLARSLPLSSLSSPSGGGWTETLAKEGTETLCSISSLLSTCLSVCFAPSSLLARWHLLNMAQEHLSGRLSMGLFSRVAVMSQVRKGVLCVNHHVIKSFYADLGPVLEMKYEPSLIIYLLSCLAPNLWLTFNILFKYEKFSFILKCSFPYNKSI